MTAVRTVAPTNQPITLAQARAQCRVDSDNTTEDTMFTGVWIPAVVAACEQLLCRSLMLQTWRLTLDCFEDEIKLPWPNLLGVTSVEYKDTAGAWQTLSASYYEVDTDSAPGRLVLASGYSWPTLFDGINTVKITYTAGYSSSAVEATQQAAVPGDVKAWLLLAVATCYAQRESIAAGMNFMDLPGRFFDSLLDRERIWDR